MRISRFALVASIFAAGLCHSLRAQTYSYWTGLGTGWLGQTPPANNGTANLYFSDSIYPLVTLSGSLDDFNSITLANGNNITFGGTATLTLLGSTFPTAIESADMQAGDLYFGTGITLNLSGFPVFNAGQNSIYITGQITGSGSPTFVETGGTSGAGAFVLNNTAANSYGGPTTIGDGANFVTVAFWGTAPFGTSGVTFNGGELIAHNTDTLTNAFSINSVVSANSEVFKSWDAPLTLAGQFTLYNNASFIIRVASTATPAPLNDGSIQLPGPYVSNPVLFTGGITGAHHLAFFGQGVAILNDSGGDTWTGGTQVSAPGSSSTPGNLVFANAGSIPIAGTITAYQNGYVGIADPTTGSFANLLTYVNQGASLGSFGIDTLPGNPTTMYSGAINLSTFTSAAVEIGSATKGEISGTITPQTSGAYQFGGGGGTLYVDSPILNMGAATLSVSNPGNSLPLTVYLQGANTYIGGTTVNDGFLIFNGSSALPSIGSLTAAVNSAGDGGSYIGYTDLVTGMTPATFLNRFNQANTYGIIGFDSSNVMSPVTISTPIDLTINSGFKNGVFIGTATAAILSGTITPTSDDTYRFTAAQNGVLTIDSAITWGNGVVLGSPNYPQYSSGTVIMDALGTGVNTYGGGTTINGGSSGLTVGLGSSTALGSGAVSISQGGLVGFEATNASVNLANPITFLDTMSDSSTLYLKGSNAFTLSGAITGDSTATIAMDNGSSFSATISGNNSGFSGSYSVFAGTLNLSPPTNGGLGSAVLDFEGPGTIDLTGASGAMSPIIKQLNGAENNGSLGTLLISSGVTAVFDTTTDNNNNSPTFGGTIAGPGGVQVQDSSGGGSGAIVLLYGNNTYGGNTTVTSGGVLVAANNNALGTGTVTVATNVHGALALDTGVTLTNPMTYTSGNLIGDGTFAPSNLSTITIGSGDGVAGGLPFASNGIVAGTLTFGGNLAFNNGGIYLWTLQDNGRVDGVSHIDVTGNLVVNATAGGFTLKVQSYDASGNAGGMASNFSIYAPYTWTILTTTGTISNFLQSDFTIDSSNFEGGGISASHFLLTENGANNQLMLSFTPVPEPSTWALLGIGAVGVAFAGVRRRRRAATA
jgi:autotransporter-associated beta strand protein